ncbi:hypothetical protein [uncultured Methanolobus sp.]|nr:hypothetical protein [uncultured Methanolobus sp.]
MNSLIYERLHSNLLDLKLNTIEQLLDNCLELAAKDETTTLRPAHSCT